MSETNSSKTYGRQPTPAPEMPPNSPAPDEPFSAADAELEELAATNKELSLQGQLLSAQVVSLTALLAEKGMAEIWRHKWADLSRVATTDYVSGQYHIETPHSDDKELKVTLRWEPGQVLLCEAFQRTPENTLALPLPSVRAPRHYPVPPPTPGTIPPLPAYLRQGVNWTTIAQEEQSELDEYNKKWQAHLRPVMTQAQHEQERTQAAAQQDEEQLAYLAIQAIQDRRSNPRKPPGQTIAAGLAAAAEQMQSHRVPSRS